MIFANLYKYQVRGLRDGVEVANRNNTHSYFPEHSRMCSKWAKGQNMAGVPLYSNPKSSSMIIR